MNGVVLGPWEARARKQKNTLIELGEIFSFSLIMADYKMIVVPMFMRDYKN